jgi:hypothetical protein
MPRYEYKCLCEGDERVFTINLSIQEYQPQIPCPCGKTEAVATRIFSSFSVQSGLTANEKKFGTTNKRKEMADFVKNQKDVRKQSYDPTTRESKSNELWLGKEGLDGVTSLPIDKKE